MPVLAGSCAEDIMAQQGKEPARSDDDRHEKARDLGEAALGKLAEGQVAEADQLIEKAKKLDESALKEIVEDLDEDAGSDPNAAKKSPG
jgi:Tfp pilus assembly protein PilF